MRIAKLLPRAIPEGWEVIEGNGEGLTAPLGRESLVLHQGESMSAEATATTDHAKIIHQGQLTTRCNHFGEGKWDDSGRVATDGPLILVNVWPDKNSDSKLTVSLRIHINLKDTPEATRTLESATVIDKNGKYSIRHEAPIGSIVDVRIEGPANSGFANVTIQCTDVASIDR